jgi:hypothetical protein
MILSLSLNSSLIWRTTFKAKFKDIVDSTGTNCTINVSEELFVALIEYYASIRTTPEANESSAKSIIRLVRSNIDYNSDDYASDSDDDDETSEDEASESDTNN